MKRKIFLPLVLSIFLLVGCSMANTPTSKVENLFTKYQKVDDDIATGIENVLDEQNLTAPHKERYKKLLEKQYKNLSYEIKDEGNAIKVDIKGEDTGYLIGYRGEVLNSIQTVLSNIASKSSKEKARVIVNIGGFREKREKDLQNLAVKIAGTVIKTKKSITLEPMSAYERKIIHTKLQENDKVKTYSVGEEPYRKVVVSLK